VSALSYDQLAALADNRRRADAPCPLCGPDRRAPANRRRKVLRIYAGDRGFYSYNCPRCGARGYAHAGGAARSEPSTLERMAARKRRVQQAADDAANEAERSARALRIWGQAQNPFGTPVESYLARRGLTLPDEGAGEAIRFHPACPFGVVRVPAMVALVRDVRTDKPKAIHRTAITESGEKVAIDGQDRLSLGPVGGGAVKLTPDADVSLCLGIGEGIESTLSLRLAIEFGASPVWALLSAGQVEWFPALGGIESLWIAVDHDEAGIKAARTTARIWRKAGREVFLLKPRAERADLNDLVGTA
jgi:putative DNA primase/helicase